MAESSTDLAEGEFISGLGGRRRTLTRRFLLATLVLAALAMVLPAQAGAHAYVVRTNPSSGAVVKSAPHSVTVVWDEPITFGSGGGAGALGVYNASGKRVDSGQVQHPAGDTLTVSIGQALPHGTYTVGWRVTSADTHVVHGAFTFSVGAPGASGGIEAKLLAREAIPAGLSDGFAVVRFFNLALLLLCAGGAVSLVSVLHDADAQVRRGLTRTLVLSASLLTLAGLLGLPFEAAEQNGTGLGGGFAAAALANLRHMRFGEVWLIRAWLALAFALVALSLERLPGSRSQRDPQAAVGRRWRPRELTLVVIGAAMAITLTAAGHASVNGPFTFIVDAVHVLGASVWLGGLAFLVGAIVLSTREDRWALAARSVPRFSTLAVITVPVLLVAGALNAYLEVHAFRGLWESTYGALVLVKIGLALPLLGLGAFNNRITVPALRASGASQDMRRRFLRAVSAELALLAAVLGVTAVLISEAPAKNSLSHAASVSSTTSVGPFTAELRVAPAQTGVNSIDLSLTNSSGKPAQITELDVAATLPSDSLGPLSFTARKLAPGRFRVSDAQLAIAGAWQVLLTVRQGQFNEWLRTIQIQIPIRTTGGS